MYSSFFTTQLQILCFGDKQMAFYSCMCKQEVKPLNLYQLIGQKQHSFRLIYKFSHRNEQYDKRFDSYT